MSNVTTCQLSVRVSSVNNNVCIYYIANWTSGARLYLAYAFYTRRVQNACNLKPSDLYRFCSARKQMALGDQTSCYELLSKIRVAELFVVWCWPEGDTCHLSCVVRWSPGAQGCLLRASCVVRVPVWRPGASSSDSYRVCMGPRVIWWSGDTVYLYTCKDRVEGVGRKRNLLR